MSRADGDHSALYSSGFSSCCCLRRFRLSEIVPVSVPFSTLSCLCLLSPPSNTLRGFVSQFGYVPCAPMCCMQVFVMTQHWGDGYFHFVVENLPRITLMLDVLRANADIKVPLLFNNLVSAVPALFPSDNVYMPKSDKSTAKPTVHICWRPPSPDWCLARRSCSSRCKL